MTTLNRPDKITLDAFSDSSLDFAGNNGQYFRFTNRLTTPLLGLKGIQMLNANFVNSALQMNDGYSLMFLYYASATQAGIRTAANLRCIRLLPSWYVPFTGFTAFTQNEYFNSVPELVAQLNLAASTGGDSITYNPRWIANELTFSYDSTTRKISVASTSGTQFIAPAGADDPFVLDFLNNRGAFSNQRPVMYGFGAAGSAYANATLQPFVSGFAMNSRLGFGMSFNNRGFWWTATSQQGCATSTGVPLATRIEADSSPILLGAQNVNIYVDIVAGSGMDSQNRKNLSASIPLEVPPLNVNSYTLSSVERPLISCPNEVYEITCELRDESGQPFVQPHNYNTQISFSIYYQ
jgi:hypothetical protein